MRLTPNTIFDAPSYINAINERILVLRDLNVPILENLSVINDIHDSIDLTNNDLKILANFPVLIKLKSLLVAKNRISSIQEDLAQFIPNLVSLSLSSNNFSQLNALKPLQSFKKLENLYLKDNHITNLDNYRLFVIWLLPQLHILDFNKIKDKERNEAILLFGTHSEPSSLAKEILISNSNPKNLEMDKETEAVQKVLQKLTDDDRERLKQELRNATSIAEIDRIENALQNGYI